MRRLLLLRHGKTERTAPSGRDRDRALTKRGSADVPLIGAYMARHGLLPSLALVSPAKRAVETFELVAACFAKPPPVAIEERIYNGDAQQLIALLSEPRHARSLLVVGHNPGIHELAVQLIASGEDKARERVNAKLPTSGLVVIDLAFDDWSLLHPQAGRLEYFVTPRLLEKATE